MQVFKLETDQILFLSNTLENSPCVLVLWTKRFSTCCSSYPWSSYQNITILFISKIRIYKHLGFINAPTSKIETDLSKLQILH